MQLPFFLFLGPWYDRGKASGLLEFQTLRFILSILVFVRYPSAQDNFSGTRDHDIPGEIKIVSDIDLRMSRWY